MKKYVLKTDTDRKSKSQDHDKTDLVTKRIFTYMDDANMLKSLHRTNVYYELYNMHIMHVLYFNIVNSVHYYFLLCLTGLFDRATEYKLITTIPVLHT